MANQTDYNELYVLVKCKARWTPVEEGRHRIDFQFCFFCEASPGSLSMWGANVLRTGFGRENLTVRVMLKIAEIIIKHALVLFLYQIYELNFSH